MKIFAITLPHRREALSAHLEERGVHTAYETHIFQGIDAKCAGLLTHRPYLLNDPARGGSHIPAQQIGCWLSHLALWRALLLLGDPYYMVIEDDVDFHPDWKERLDTALRDVPSDFDMLIGGHCCVIDKPMTPVAGQVMECKQAFCTHCYIVAHKALNVLIETQKECYAPIDIALTLHSYPVLKTYIINPRFASQRGTPLPP